jgi:hypothetical protein
MRSMTWATRSPGSCTCASLELEHPSRLACRLMKGARDPRPVASRPVAPRPVLRRYRTGALLIGGLLARGTTAFGQLATQESVGILARPATTAASSRSCRLDSPPVADCARRLFDERDINTPFNAQPGHGHSRRFHVLVGGAAGFVVGTAIGVVRTRNDTKDCHDCGLVGLAEMINPVVYGLAGAIVGGAIAALLPAP